jgi:2-succinyl-6-hydroxy-2,4-cyclohexadiene-1-carboxylate synthase
MPLHAERRGQGPTLVLVHGFTQIGRSWAAIADDLATDHEVVLVDAPGHGRSADVAVDLVAGGSLLGDAGGRATYVGYSMGARLCLHTALGHPDLVSGLVLVGGTAGIEDADERAARRQQDRDTADRLERDGLEAFLAWWLTQPLFADLTPDQAGIEARRENTVAGLRSSLEHAGTGSQEPLWDCLGELAMPVLALAGARDERYAALAQRMAGAVGSSARAAVVPDAGHAAHLERPDAFLRVLRAWLAEHEL